MKQCFVFVFAVVLTTIAVSVQADDQLELMQELPHQKFTVCYASASFGEGSSNAGVYGVEQSTYSISGYEYLVVFSEAVAGARTDSTWHIDRYGFERETHGIMKQLFILARHRCDYVVVGVHNDVWTNEFRATLLAMPSRIAAFYARLGQLQDGVVDEPPIVLYERYPNMDVDNPFIAHVMEGGYREFNVAFEQAILASGGHVIDTWLMYEPANTPTTDRVWGRREYHPTYDSVRYAASVILGTIGIMELCQNPEYLECPEAYYTGMWARPLPAFYGPRPE